MARIKLSGREIGRANTVLTVALGVVIALFVVGAVAAQLGADRILPGVTIAGIQVGGMTRPEAVQAIDAAARRRLDAPLTVTAADRSWTLPAHRVGLRAETDTAVTRAIENPGDLGFVGSLWHRLRDEPVNASVDLGYALQESDVDALLAQIAKQVDRPSVDAAVRLQGGRMVFQRAETGQALDKAAAKAAVQNALLQGKAKVQVPVKTLLPEVSNERQGDMLVVKLMNASELRPALQASGVDALVAQMASQAARRPVDAAVRLAEGRLVVQRPEVGHVLDVAGAKAAVQKAILAGEARVRVPVKLVAPQISGDNLGSTVVVNLTENRIYLYRGIEVERSYRVATALPPSSTPPGEWRIVNRAMHPTWNNPAPDTWGADRPPVVPPGHPDNPLGSRALYLNAPGIRIHATIYPESIGTYASHGCIRMLRSEIEDLYPRVPIGTRVLVHGTPPANLPTSS